MIEDKNTPTPETALFNQNTHQAQVTTIVQQFRKQIDGLENDIATLQGKTDAYSVGQRDIYRKRLIAINDMVSPLIEKLRQTSDAMTVVESQPRLDPAERNVQLARLREQFNKAMQNLSVISQAQEQAHGARITREEASAGTGEDGKPLGMPVERVQKRSKTISDPISTDYAYGRARANAERLLPYVYRALTQVKKTDLAQKYTSNLITNWRLLGGIETRNDLNAALSDNPDVRATSNDRALFTTTALRVMMILRDQYAYDEKNSVVRGQNEIIPKSASKRFLQLMGQEIERDPILQQRATQQLDLLHEFMTGNNFRSLWDGIDHTARAAAYEWARNEKVDKRWDALSPDEANYIADSAGGLLYGDHRPFGAASLGDPQRRVTKDLNLTPEERQQIMRDEAARITQMMRDKSLRGTWAHGEPVNSTRFHDKLRAVQPTPSPSTDANHPTSSAAALVINARRFAMA